MNKFETKFNLDDPVYFLNKGKTESRKISIIQVSKQRPSIIKTNLGLPQYHSEFYVQYLFEDRKDGLMFGYLGFEESECFATLEELKSSLESNEKAE